MKMFILAFSFMLSAQANEQDQAQRFQERKEKMISHLDERINQLNKAKGCLQSAQNHDSMKECKNNLKSGMSQLKDDFMDERKEQMMKNEEVRRTKFEEKMKRMNKKN
jgi:hypothetical protein